MGRLLILSSDTGEGHNSAAAAIGGSALEAGWEVSIAKPSEDSSAGYRTLNGFYNFLLTHRPGLVGALFRAIDVLKPNEVDFCYRRVRDYIGRLIDREAPDSILSVHPMLNHFIQRWVFEHDLGIPCYTFVTDPFPPFWKGWSSPYIDRYFVLTEEAGEALAENGVERDRIEQVSMPMRRVFRPHTPEEVAALRSNLGIEGDVILVNGGARGGGPIERLIRTIRECRPNLNVLAACGHNAALRHRLDRAGYPGIRTFGYVNEIHSLVGLADLVVTKPGALSTYESLASRVPAVLTAIGGLMPQESGLFNAARHRGFGFAVRTLDELRSVVSRGVDDWQKKRDAIADFYRPGAAPELIERIEPSHVRP